MAVPLAAVNSTFPVGAFVPIEFSDEDRVAIDKKIKELIGSRRHQTIFFEHRPDEKKYYFIFVGGGQISFSEEEASSTATRAAVNRLFSAQFSKIKQVIYPKDITFIDGVYHRVITTALQVNNNRNFHTKVPYKTDCLQGFLSEVSIVGRVIRDTFDNLTGSRYNY